MKFSPRSHIWILFMIALMGLFSCKSSMHSKSVFGGKKGNLKSVFQRYQSRDFKAKNEKKKQPLKVTDEKEGNQNETPSTVTQTAPSTPTVTNDNPEISVNEDNLNSLNLTDEVSKVNSTEESLTEITSDELISTSDYAEITTSHKALSASINIAKNTSLKVIKNITEKATTSIEKEGIEKTAQADFRGLSGIYKKFYNGDFRTGLKELKINAEKKGKSYLWVLYFAIAQAFTAMFLGFKNIFQMLDTPIDAGNKALGISYAAIAILTIHTLLLVGLVKNFM
jgi:hypothetical protein